jgi:hypothetical protein
MPINAKGLVRAPGQFTATVLQPGLKSPEDLEASVESWFSKKFQGKQMSVAKRHEELCPDRDWRFMLVFGDLKHPEELPLLENRGVEVKHITHVLDELRNLKETRTSSEASGVAELLEICCIEQDGVKDTREDVVFETRFDKRGDTIHLPKRVLEEMGLPTERNAIRDANVYLYVTVHGEDGEHLGTRRKRLLPKRSIYWPIDGESFYPSYTPIRVHLRRAV